MRVLIVGGGVAGLALGKFLEEKGIDYKILEKSKSLKTVGFILTIWPNGVKILKELGVGEKVLKKSTLIPYMKLKDKKGRDLFTTDFGKINEKHGHTIEVERDVVYRALNEIIPKKKLIRGMSVTDLKDYGDKVEATFINGEKEKFDLVVGADGIDSVVREIIQPRIKKDYTGHRAWIIWVPTKMKAPKGIEYHMGDKVLAAFFPTENKKHFCGYFSIPSPPAKKTGTHGVGFLMEHCKTLDNETLKILNSMKNKPEEFFYNNDYEVHDMHWRKGRIVLAGDSAHALSPMTGMGASMALEDAKILVEEISSKKDIEKALENYEKRRLKRVIPLARKSKQLHSLLNLPSIFLWPRDFFLRHLYGPMYFRSMNKFLSQKI